jgi:hypothetical protein
MVWTEAGSSEQLRTVRGAEFVLAALDHTSEGPIADEIAELIGMPPERLVPRLEAAMTSFLKLRGNQRIVVDRALAEAAKDWHRIPIHRLPAPEPPDKCALAGGHL